MTAASWRLFPVLALACTPLGAADQLTISLPVHAPSNVFWQGGTVTVASSVRASAAGPADLTLVLTDYRKQEVVRRTKRVELAAGTASAVDWELGALPDGYYVAALDAAAGPLHAAASASLGVAPRIERSAVEAMSAGCRIGLKMFYLGKAPWHGNVDWDERSAVTATTGLGLQWTRALLQDASQLPTTELLTAFPMNAVLKVERFPKELYDAERYGPLEDYEKKNGRGTWTLRTLPRKEPYQAWLRQELAKIPASQQVFEVWNEAWDKLTPEDLATLCNWIGEAIHADRPNALIGPNLKGVTSRYEYDAKVIDAGGMKGMDLVCLHPYAGSEDRAWLRGYRAWLRERLGRDIAIYVTEYGSHSTPAGPAKRSEEEQAQRVVTQTLALYAEDVKAMTPHWMGQREENPTYIEDWFGFFRLDQQPKPDLLALATCARLIDGGRYVGDLWCGPGVGAMLFEKGGVRTLALYTREGTRSVTLPASIGAGELRLLDLVGAPRPLPTRAADGGLVLEVGPDVQYLVGVDAALAKATSTELRADQWPAADANTVRAARKAPKLAASPQVDGKLDEWRERLQIGLLNPKVAGDDASGLAGVAWDAQNLYLAFEIRDNQILNNRPEPKMYQQDSIELFLSTEVRDHDPGYGPRDHQYLLTPTTAAGTPLLAEVVERSSGKFGAIPGATFAVVAAKPGWTAEVAIPWTSLGVAPGSRLALDMRLNDADASHERWKVDPLDSKINTEDPTKWAVLECVEK